MNVKTYLHRLWRQLTREPAVLCVLVYAALVVVTILNYGVDVAFLAH